jgi:hypothetical protein
MYESIYGFNSTMEGRIERGSGWKQARGMWDKG